MGGRSWTAVEVASEPFPFMTVALTEAPDACAELMSAATTEQRFFVIGVPGKVGSYPIAASVDAAHADAVVEHGCTERSTPPDTEVHATSGTVRVDVHDAGMRAAGHYDLTFSTGEHLLGDFDTCVCSSARSCSTPAKP
jgi:hypothetical protein